MKITDLAALVTVRNHIATVMNDKSVSGKDDFRPLNDARIKLDKKFIAALKETDVESLFSDNVVIYFNDPNIIPAPFQETGRAVSQASETLTLELPPTDGVWEDADTTPDHPDDTEDARRSLREQRNEEIDDRRQGNLPNLAEAEAEADAEAAELALIAERVKVQKEQLKKEGRSNKRISKAKEDGAS